MITHGNEIKLFAGNSNLPLARAIAAKLNTSLGDVEVTKFSERYAGGISSSSSPPPLPSTII